MGQLENLKTDISRLLEIKVLASGITRDIHYSRNDNQKPDVDYVDLLLERYKWKSGDPDALKSERFAYTLQPDQDSTFHQLNLHGESDNQNNSKWVHVDKTSEHVFKYTGSGVFGRFMMLSDDPSYIRQSDNLTLSYLNLGTYNFGPDKVSHTALDILPWILWGNNERDSLNWDMFDRAALAGAAFGDQQRINAIDAASDKLAEFLKPAADTFNGVSGWVGSRLKWKDDGDNSVVAGTSDEEVFRGRAGSDTVDYSGSSSGVTVSLERKAGFDGDAKWDKFFSIENVTGTIGGDILIGNGKANILKGEGGNDILVGRGGDDILDGGSGANDLRGDRGDDTFFVSDTKTVVKGGVGRDTVFTDLRTLRIDKEHFKGVEVFALMEPRPDATQIDGIIGSSRGEEMIGNSSDNWLQGRGGADILDGGTGQDSLDGGKGNDGYVMRDGWGSSIISEEGGFDALIFQDHALSDLRLERDTGVNGTHLKVYSTDGQNDVFVWNQFTQNKKLSLERLITTDGELDLKGGLPLTGTDAGNSIKGTEFDDLIDLKGGDDFLYALGGEDLIIGGEGDDILYGGEDNDTYIFKPGFGHDRIVEEGAYQFENDSDGDVIELQGIARSSVEISTDFQGRMTIEVLGFGGDVTDSIFIPSQEYNYGEGLLVEYIRFDDGALIPLTTFLDLG